MERDEAIRVIESNWPNDRIMISEALTVAIADMRAMAKTPAKDDEILLRDSFRQLRSAWFEAHLETHAQERVWETEEEELRRKEQNTKLRLEYDADTEAIIEQAKRCIAPRCPYDMEARRQ